MRIRRPVRPVPLRAAAVIGVAALALAACGSSSTSAGGGATAAPSAAAPGSAAPADSGASGDLNYAGTLRDPATTSRPAAKGKKIVIISTGQASISSSIPSNAAKEAAQALGWSADIYDSQLNPALAEGLVRQAIASGAQGIILDAIDCPTVKGAMQEAKAKGIKLVGIYAFDCNDPIFGSNDPPLFTGQINYGDKANADIGSFTKQYGADQAKAVIAATKGKAKVVFFNDSEVTVLRYTGQGFLDEMKKCSGCQVLEQVDFKGAELGPNLQQKATTALLKHPDANAVKSPFTAASLLGIAPAVVQSGHASQIYSMGGEGFAPELDLLRANQGVSAVMITPSEWTAWAAVDTMNSLFAGTPIADSGLGWQLVDKTHNLPPSGPFETKQKFKADYKKAWGV